MHWGQSLGLTNLFRSDGGNLSQRLMKRKKHSVEFVLLFEFVPLALGKLVYSEEPFGNGSLKAVCQQVFEPVSAPRK